MHTCRNVIRLFMEPGFARRLLGARVRELLRSRLSEPAPMPTEDRRVLEQVIFPYYIRNPDVRTVLFVGCDSYTAHYGSRYFAAHDYWTLDPDRARRRFGAKQHVVAPLEQLGRHFIPGFFNLIICNGVYGWGLDRAADCEAALSQCDACLADGGYLLFGWNDVPQRDPAPLSSVHGFALFADHTFPAWGSARYLTDTPYRHTYHLYRKRS